MNLIRKSGALAVVLAGLLTGAVQAGSQTIYVQNNSDQTIWVAAHYIPADCKHYISDGFWKVEPGQRVHIVNNNGVWIYLHAHKADGTESRGSGSPVRHTIRGRTVDLYPYDTGEDFNPRVITFFDVYK